MKLSTTELVAHGDMAHEMGTYSLDIKPPKGRRSTTTASIS